MAGLLLLGVTVVHADTPPATSPTGPTIPSIWERKEYSFAFLGFTTTYSCDGLADKLKTLLLAAGARPDAKAQPGACSYGYGRPDKFARANLIFYTLAPAGASPPPETPLVDGTWRTVALARRSPRTLELGDCELVEQFKSSVLPLFQSRNVVSSTTCVPHQDSGSVIDLKFETLAPIPKAGRSGKR